MLTEPKREINSNEIILRDFKILLTTMDRSSRQKINNEKSDLNSTSDQVDLTDIYNIFHPTAAGYTFFSSTHGAFSRVNHMSGHETNLNNFKKIEII